jgi:hypothetical protein
MAGSAARLLFDVVAPGLNTPAPLSHSDGRGVGVKDLSEKGDWAVYPLRQSKSVSTPIPGQSCCEERSWHAIDAFLV